MTGKRFPTDFARTPEGLDGFPWRTLVSCALGLIVVAGVAIASQQPPARSGRAGLLARSAVATNAGQRPPASVAAAPQPAAAFTPQFSAVAYPSAVFRRALALTDVQGAAATQTLMVYIVASDLEAAELANGLLAINQIRQGGGAPALNTTVIVDLAPANRGGFAEAALGAFAGSTDVQPITVIDLRGA